MAMKKKTNGIALHHYKSATSTNTIALDARNANHLDVFVADKQTQGRGRMNRKFLSPNGGLYMSVILDPKKISCGLNLCTLAVAVAVRRALSKYTSEEITVKWVNDLLINEKKVAGILTEARSVNGKVYRVVTGIGVNLVKLDCDIPSDIINKIGFIDCNVDKLLIAAEIAAEIDKTISVSPVTLLDEYKKYMAFLGRKIKVSDYSTGIDVEGTVRGVDEDGWLVLMIDGSDKHISSGEMI